MSCNVKEVDCALIFMLDEERDLFLENNEDFIITSKPESSFIEFIFFDKDMSLRTGVICSNEKKMGNSEAGQLFYRLSRYYKAHLYINLGVAGLIDDMNIGDVLIVERLSTMGENNANNTDKQNADIIIKNQKAINAVNDLRALLTDFSKNTRTLISEFKKNLKETSINTSLYPGFDKDFQHNKIISGRCVTVPEVIKDKSKWPEFKKFRKINLIDMEAYYIALWHDLVKECETENSIKSSQFLAFKSVSDYGDENKALMEQCGSRRIAMKNLCSVVSAYCTGIHKYKRKSTQNVYDYLYNDVSNKSLDSIIQKSQNIALYDFEKLFSHVTSLKCREVDNSNPIAYAQNLLNQSNQAILLTGRSGTGKSTFLSYLYKTISEQKKCVLIDFSRFSSQTTPTDKQIASLLEGLINKNLNCLIFLDGLRVGSDSYEMLKQSLQKHNYSNISFCIGNVDDDFEDLYDIVSAKNEINEISFFGLTVCHPNFQKMIEDSEKFFSNVNKNYNKETIIKLINNAGLTIVDFRLLSMFAKYEGNLSKKENFIAFIKSYLSSKYTEEDFKNYWEKQISCDTVDDSVKTARAEFNTYFTSIAIAKNMIGIFTNNRLEEIKLALQRNYILSDDMNLVFELILKEKKQYGVIVRNMINALDNNSASISTETQLIYNIARTLSDDSTNFKLFKKFVEDKTKQIEEKIKSISETVMNTKYYDYIIEYRTLCIIMNSCFDNKTYLDKFNEKLVARNSDYCRCNLVFHLFYYSKRVFNFDMLNSFELRQSNYEMYCNTFYILKKSIEEQINKIEETGPQFVMNVSTILYLVECMIKKKNIIDELVDPFNELTQQLLKAFKATESSYINKDTIERLSLQAQKALDELNLS